MSIKRNERRQLAKEIEALQTGVREFLKANGLEAPDAANPRVIAQLSQVVGSQPVQVSVAELMDPDRSPTRAAAMGIVRLVSGLTTGEFIVVTNPLYIPPKGKDVEKAPEKKSDGTARPSKGSKALAGRKQAKKK